MASSELAGGARAGVELPIFNVLRWVSAFVVMGGHGVGWAFDMVHDRYPTEPVLIPLRYLLDMGHGAVVVFFVVSGYLVGGSVLARAERFNWRQYATARFARIYIVVAPVLLLTAGLDGLIYLIAPHNPIYAAPWGWLGDTVFAHYGWSNVLAAVTSLESLVGTPMGSGQALWSLGLEWAFYFFLPAAVWLARRVVARTWFVILACFALAVPMGLAHGWLAIYWTVWFAGAAARMVKVPAWLSIAGGLAGAAALLLLPFVDRRLATPIEGMGLALFLAWPAALNLRINSRLDHRLASLSFSLYVVHVPMMMFTAFWLWRGGLLPLARNPYGVQGFVCLACFWGVSLATAWAFSVLFEQRTDPFRAWLSGKPAVAPPKRAEAA